MSDLTRLGLSPAQVPWGQGFLSPQHLQPCQTQSRCSVNAAGPELPQGGPTHRQLLLQADAERLGVVGFQLFQGHSCLPDELVVAEFVLITHGDPGRQGHGHRSDTPGTLRFHGGRGLARGGRGVDTVRVRGAHGPGPSPTAGSSESCLRP